MELNEHLRSMLKELGRAINESISGSGRVRDSIRRIHDEGYNLYMVLDARVGVNRRGSRSGARRSASDGNGEEAAAAGERAAFRINVKDLGFLKSVGIDPTRKVRVRTALSSPRRSAPRPVPVRLRRGD